jgi:hypothetical protein
MAKSQKKSAKEIRKPKATKAAAVKQTGSIAGLENMKNKA